MKMYVAMKYGRPRAEVEAEISERTKVTKKEEPEAKESVPDMPMPSLKRTEREEEVPTGVPTIDIGEEEFSDEKELDSPMPTVSENMSVDDKVEVKMPMKATQRPVEGRETAETSRKADGEENYFKIR